MNLRSVDLNLLVALDALLHERHVTRAAGRVGLSQPAMSAALGRLRQIFGDEILVRTAAGMQATPRALELVEPVRAILRQIERVLDAGPGFEPATSARAFSLRLSDLLGLLLLPPLLADLGTAAPRVSLRVAHLPPDRTVEALEKDEIDLAVSTGLVHASSIASRTLLPDRMVCLMRAGHPAAGRLDLDAFLGARHLRVAQSTMDVRFVDDALAARGLARDVAITVPHWLVAPAILAGSDLLAVVPERFARTVARDDLAVRDLPLPADAFAWSAYWHRRHAGDAGLAWLRAAIGRAAGSGCP